MNTLRTLARWLREAYFVIDRDGRILFCLGNRAEAERAITERVAA